MGEYPTQGSISNPKENYPSTPSLKNMGRLDWTARSIPFKP